MDPPAAVCPITYSCSVSGPRTDICSILDGATVANFDPVTGNYDFQSVDMANYPAGAYNFTIKGTVGAKSVTETFVMTLVDPCPTTTLTIKQPDPFTDKTYVLRAPQINQIWDINKLITKATAVDCGALTVEFFIDDAA